MNKNTVAAIIFVLFLVIFFAISGANSSSSNSSRRSTSSSNSTSKTVKYSNGDTWTYNDNTGWGTYKATDGTTFSTKYR